MGLFDFRDIKKRHKKKETINIVCNADEVRINDTIVTFPTSYSILKELIGEASRIEPFKQTGINVYLWDELGVYCSMPDPEHILMLMLIKDNGYDLGHQPRKNFNSHLLIDGKVVTDEFPNINPNRPYIVRGLIKGQKLVAIAIGWNSKL